MRFHRFVKIVISFLVVILMQYSFMIHFKEKKIDVEGVIDRIVDDRIAIILIEEKKEQIIVPLDELPITSEEGMLLKLVKTNERYRIIAIDEEMIKQSLKNRYLLIR